MYKTNHFNKVICIVQARMGSERLQGKVIKPIMNKPMILYTLDRLKKSRLIDEIILATSDRDQEIPLVNIVKEHNYNIFRGDESNVLKRYKDAVEEYDGDIIIRITGDCPLIDHNIVDFVINKYLIYDYDYVKLDVPNSFVRGFDVEVFSKEALCKVWDIVNSTEITENVESYIEHVTLYMYRHPNEFKIGCVCGDELYSKDYRLCVDTVEDFELVQRIYGHFQDEFIDAASVIKYLDKNPDVANINKQIKQKKV